MTGLGHWIDRWADVQPHRTAIAFQGREISYGALAERIRQFARTFAGAGIARGDRIAVLGTNHPDFLAAVFAGARIGAIIVPFNWRLAAAEHGYLINDAEPKLLLATAEFREHSETLRASFAHIKLAAIGFAVPGWIPLDDGPGEGADANPGVGYDDPLLIVYTSGTTGRSKGAVLSQNAVFWNAVNATHAHDLTSADHVLTVIPIFHVGGLNIQTIPALHAGASVTLHPRFDADATLREISTGRPTLTVQVPATARAMIDSPLWKTADLSSLRMVSMGSSVIPAPIIRAFHDRGVPVAQIYGATETAPIAIYLRAEDCERIGSTGKPAIHCEVKAIDRDGALVADGVQGEICVRGPNILTGYWRNEPATREALRDGWFHTGDIGYRDADGFWFITDRSKDVIISGGENVYPAELEAVLHECERVQECAVVARLDARWGEVPVAFVVRKPDCALSRDDVLALFEGRLARFKLPRDVFFVEALPRNAMGKILKSRLREQLRESAA
jgi:fatty-acyl-CoA synthase